ncbi:MULTISPECIES: hypothetical protein [unclassified Sphingobium]|uniref:hypothetical protein n=1 Tax=unclassified Sphingobium TaxID=2611147 RepID=UPI0022255560|nr:MULTISPECIES: hypothetical protein [unclassified Sphingobium]MCW2413206.1 hypothetical protein [Sphingobium sp. B8D3D]MCW2414496.1 hypothetical protein [Sphingobium sp. B8D3A]
MTNSADDEDACVHTHPIPAAEISRYSPISDPDAEQDIINYVNGQAPDENIANVKRIKTEYVLGDKYEIWDVTTDVGRWWVITNLTNLYSQNHFPSLDYTLSFHIGLMMRLKSRSSRPDSEEPDPFDEVFRRREQADDRYERAVEAEDYQAVGMQLRECLISLTSVMQRRMELSEAVERPTAADFKAWADIFVGEFCRGPSNKELRSYLKSCADKTWDLVNWLTHDRNANDTACSITLHATDTIIGHLVQLTMRKLSGDIQICPRCQSRNIRSHYDIDIAPDGAYYTTCGLCGWSSHPGYDLDHKKSPAD